MSLENSEARAPSVAEVRHPVAADKGGESESEANQVRRLMNGLVSMLSHDLRTPLSAISGWLFLLESDKLDAVARKRALGKIKSNIDEQVRLIDDVVLLSRCKTGDLELDLVAVSALRTLSGAIDTVRASAVASNVTLEGPLGVDVAVSADPARLGRALELMLARAIKSTPNGGRITVGVRPLDTGAEVTIVDNGRGVNPAALKYLLDPLARPADGASRAHGMDKGLLLADALVQAHHGELRIESAGEGLGTTVRIALLPAPRRAAQT